MGTPWWNETDINNKYYHPNDNFLIRSREILNDESEVVGHELLNERRVGRIVEEFMLLVDMLRDHYDLFVVQQWYIYDILIYPEGEDPEDYKNGPSWIVETFVNPPDDPDTQKLPMTPSASMNSLVGYHCLVKNQYYDVLYELDRVSPDGNPDDAGVLQRLTGSNTTFLSGNLPWLTGFSANRTSGGAKSENSQWIYEEDWNYARPKSTVAFLFEDRIKIYNILGAVFPMDNGINNRTVSDENLLCEFYLRDELFNKVTGATAMGEAPDSGGFPSFYVAFGSTIRRYDYRGRPVPITGTTYFIVATGSIDAIQHISGDARPIHYIVGGELRAISLDGITDGERMVRRVVGHYPTYETLEGSFVDFVPGTGRVGGILRGDILWDFRHGIVTVESVSSLVLQYGVQFSTQPDKLMNISGSSRCFMSPFKYYFNAAGEHIVPNIGHKNLNLLVASGATAQIQGRWQIEGVIDTNINRILYLYSPLGFPGYPLDTYSLSSGFSALTRYKYYEAFVEEVWQHREQRAVWKVNVGALGIENITDKRLRVKLNFTANRRHAYLATIPVVPGLWDGYPSFTVDVYYYTGARPVVANSTNFNATGTLIGTLTFNAVHIDFGSPFEDYNQLFTTHDFVDLPLDNIQDDGFVWLMLVKTDEDDTYPGIDAIENFDPETGYYIQAEPTVAELFWITGETV